MDKRSGVRSRPDLPSLKIQTKSNLFIPKDVSISGYRHTVRGAISAVGYPENSLIVSTPKSLRRAREGMDCGEDKAQKTSGLHVFDYLVRHSCRMCSRKCIIMLFSFSPRPTPDYNALVLSRAATDRRFTSIYTCCNTRDDSSVSFFSRFQGRRS